MPLVAPSFLRRAGMRMHLGGIGKGYAVDRAAARLRADGVADFLIQAGGDLYAGGSHGDRSLAHRHPRSARPCRPHLCALNLRDETFSTSGDYERYSFTTGAGITTSSIRMKDGRRKGAAASRSWAKQQFLPTRLSTGVFVLGPQAGMALIEKLPDVEGVIVSDRNEVLVSSGLTGRLERMLEPTDAP
jgi:thiamine biosynthesis lipoprotein